MRHSFKKIFLNNVQIKIISIILGYSFWHIFSLSHTCLIWMEAPLSFYNMPKNLQIESPEKVKIQLSAKRADLYTIDKETLAFHINMQHAKEGNIITSLTKEQLLLPETIKIVRYYPANVAIKVIKKNT